MVEISQIDLDDIMIPLLDSMVIEDMPKIWKDSKYIKQRQIQPDKRGSVGERFFAESLLKLYPRRIEYNDGDQGDWDLKIGRIRLEIKTASLDVNNRFQNEGLKENGNYDGVLFLGIAPEQLYVKFIKKSDIPFSILHNRGKAGTGTGHKWTLKISDMIKINTLGDVKSEFESCFGPLLKKKK